MEKTLSKKYDSHGCTGTRIYQRYLDMKKRCYNSNSHNYRHYGGRGITVCKRWLESFNNFYHDMGDMPDGYTLDRIDNNKGYSPKNCKWSTKSEQNMNQRPRGKSSKLRGVSLYKIRNMFQSHVGVKGVKIYLGCFQTEYEAGVAYDIYVIKNGLPNLLNGGSVLWEYKMKGV